VAVYLVYLMFSVEGKQDKVLCRIESEIEAYGVSHGVNPKEGSRELPKKVVGVTVDEYVPGLCKTNVTVYWAKITPIISVNIIRGVIVHVVELLKVLMYLVVVERKS
jgi:hypothetical protein